MRGDCLHLLTHMHKQSTMYHTIALVSIIMVYGLYAYAAFCQKFNLCDRSLSKDTPSELIKYRNCTIIIRLATYIIISGQALDFMRKLKIIQQKDERFFCFCYFYLLSCIFIVAACQTFTAWFYSCVRWQLHAWHEPAQRRLSERAHFARPDAV